MKAIRTRRSRSRQVGLITLGLMAALQWMAAAAAPGAAAAQRAGAHGAGGTVALRRPPSGLHAVVIGSPGRSAAVGPAAGHSNHQPLAQRSDAQTTNRLQSTNADTAADSAAALAGGFRARRGYERASDVSAGGSKDTSDDYQLDDGSGSIEIGVPAGGVNILWFTRYTVLPGLSNIRTVNAAWGGTVPPGSPARVGLYSDPNGDGTPTDSVVLANLLVVTSDEGTNVVNKYNINDVVIGPNGTNFFAFAHRGLTVAGEYPARGDSTAPIPTNRCWIATVAPVSPPTGAVLIESISGLANKWMIRANAGPPIICGDFVCSNNPINYPCVAGTCVAGGGTCVPVCLPEEECTCPTDCGPPPGGNENAPANGPLACQDGLDNDCDTLIDCLDADCIGAFPESPGAANCNDGKDNDCDGDIDCADAACATATNCLTCLLSSCPGTAEGEPVCFNGYKDNFDAGCNGDLNPPLEWRVIAAPPIGGAPVQICGQSGRHTTLCKDNTDCPTGQTCNAGTGNCSGGTCATSNDCLDTQTCVGLTCTAGQPPVRDTDWYKFVIPPGGDRSATLCVTSEFEALIGIVDDQGGPNCFGASFVSSNVGSGDFACTQVCTDPVCLTPGTWTAYVAPSAGTANLSVPCGLLSEYTMALTADACRSPVDLCSVGDVNQCQLPNQSPNADEVAAASDAHPGTDLRVADNFRASSAGSLQEVCWWGAYVDFGGTPTPCASVAADDFTITYYNDNNGGTVPGTVKCGPFHIDSLIAIPSGLVIPSSAGDLDEYSYATSHPACNVAAGECVWVEVQNNTDGNQTCAWLWETAAPGDGRSAQHAGAPPYLAGDETDFDLAWCVGVVVEPEGCEPRGACCDDATASCTNDVLSATCNAQGGRFTADTLCNALPHPCGGGGCCTPAGGCSDALPAGCVAPNQFHPGAFCESTGGTLICNTSGTGDWDNGPGDPLGAAVVSQFAPGDYWAEAADNFIMKETGHVSTIIHTIRWWATLLNDVSFDPLLPLCNDGQCSVSGNPCDSKAATPCPLGEGLCQAINPGCTKTPDDYTGIRVTIYEDVFSPLVVKQFDDACASPIPDEGGMGFTAPAVCAGNQECIDAGLGNVCVDTDLDDVPDSCGTQCEIVVTGDPGWVHDLDVGLRITHTWVGDLKVVLEKVGSARIVLIDRPGTVSSGRGCPSNNYNIMLDDDGAGGPIENICGANISPTPTSPPNYVPNSPLSAFNGTPKEGVWRITVTDHAMPDPGTLASWSLIFNNGAYKGPAGVPEHGIPVGLDCANAQGCIDAGCPADSVCVADQCRFPVECATGDDCIDCHYNDDDCTDLGPCNTGTCATLGTCGPLIPTGNHVHLMGNDPSSIKHELIVTPSMFTWMPYIKEGNAVPDAFEITMDLSSVRLVIENNKKYFIAISPEMPFANFYQTAWMTSQNYDGNPAQRVFEGLGVFPWALVGPPQSDLAFELIGTTAGDPFCPADPTNNDPSCWDTNSDGIRDSRCVWWDCDSGVCTSANMVTLDAGGPFGACPLDGFCNVFDRNHALTCFAGTNACSDFAADLGGAFGACPNDGFCNIHDASHALRCFAGTNTCVCPSPRPSPGTALEFGPIVAGGAHLTLSANKKTVWAGAEIHVRVFIAEALPDLSGYQLHLEVSGGRRGSLKMIEISIDPTLGRNSVFGDAAHYEAFNITTGQMLNGREENGVATPANGYLATYTYRASADAAGSFVVDVMHDEANQDQTYLLSDMINKVEVLGTTPAVIEVISHERQARGLTQQ